MFVQRLNEYTPKGEPVLDTFAEVQQQWHLWRRRYDLFLRDAQHHILSMASEPQPEPEPKAFTQFARIDEGLFAWHFRILDGRKEEIASVKRAFRGFGRELFTDTGQYFVRFGPDLLEPNHLSPRPIVVRDLNLEERALVLAMSVNIDFDYFSRHSGSHGIGLGMWGDLE